MIQTSISKCVADQLLASLCMLKDCINRCSDNDWNASHNDYPFSRVVFHTLFDCDLILSENESELRNQLFHKQNKTILGDYEELNDQIAKKEYSRNFIITYYDFCINKIETILANSTNETLLIENNDFYKTMTKLERYINCIRHTQHHAAQLGLRLQLITKNEMEWIGRL